MTSLVSTAVLVGHWLLVLGLSLRVITRRLPVGVSMAWIAVMWSVPLVGAVLYLFFGEKRLGRRRARYAAASTQALRDWQEGLRLSGVGERPKIGAAAEPLGRLAESLLGFPALPGNSLELLDDDQAFFDAIVADLDAARETCDLAFYIWHGHGRVLEVVDALVRASGRGVRCRALADAVGSQDFLRSDLARRLRQAGVELRAALPTGLLRSLFSRADLRNHRKIVAIDGRIAYAGSQNLVDPRFFKQEAGAGKWVDAMARLDGPAAAALGGVFALDWALETGERFVPPALVHHEGVRAPERSRSVIQVAPSGPAVRPEAIHQLLLAAIYAARREIVLTTPYFVPEESLLTALLSAAGRGVAVILVLPAYNDSLLVHHAGAAHFDDLLAAGVRIALFTGGLLHTKSLTLDGETSLFGSVNFDMRSLWLNFEISLLIYDPGFTARLCALQSRYLDDSEMLDLGAWRRRPAWRRITEDTLRLLSPLL